VIAVYLGFKIKDEKFENSVSPSPSPPLAAINLKGNVRLSFFDTPIIFLRVVLILCRTLYARPLSSLPLLPPKISIINNDKLIEIMLHV